MINPNAAPRIGNRDCGNKFDLFIIRFVKIPKRRVEGLQFWIFPGVSALRAHNPAFAEGDIDRALVAKALFPIRCVREPELVQKPNARREDVLGRQAISRSVRIGPAAPQSIKVDFVAGRDSVLSETHIGLKESRGRQVFPAQAGGEVLAIGFRRLVARKRGELLSIIFVEPDRPIIREAVVKSARAQEGQSGKESLTKTGLNRISILVHRPAIAEEIERCGLVIKIEFIVIVGLSCGGEVPYIVFQQMCR